MTKPMKKHIKTILLAGAAAVLALAGTNASFAADKKTLAFVVNGASDFWKAAEAGVKKAQGELPNYSLVFKFPEGLGGDPDPADGRPVASGWPASW